MIDIGDVKAAATRISKYIRRTPLLRADQCAAPASDADLWLKLECLQPTGSFKVRGATNKLLTTPRAESLLRRGEITGSRWRAPPALPA
jgi:threonine dehydratase